LLLYIYIFFGVIYVGAHVEVYSDGKKIQFFQDKMMKEYFSALMFIDATYKLLNLGIPTFLMLSEDSNGHSKIVGVRLLVSEDAENIKWMLTIFKKCNEKWSSWQIKI